MNTLYSRCRLEIYFSVREDIITADRPTDRLTYQTTNQRTDIRAPKCSDASNNNFNLEVASESIEKENVNVPEKNMTVSKIQNFLSSIQAT